MDGTNKDGTLGWFPGKKKGKKKIFIFTSMLYNFHSFHTWKSLSKFSATSKPILSSVIQSKSGAIVHFPWYV